jgi:hypothetical protein
VKPYEELRASALRTLSSEAPAPPLNIGKRYPVGCPDDDMLWNCQEPMRDLPDDPAALYAEMWDRMHFDPRHEIVRTTAKILARRGFPDAWEVARAARFVARAARFAAGDERKFWRAAM